jgi:hypothetical protein
LPRSHNYTMARRKPALMMAVAYGQFTLYSFKMYIFCIIVMGRVHQWRDVN